MLGILDVGVEFSDVVLKPFDPVLLLGNVLTTLLFTATDQLREVISQSLILFVACIGEGRTNDSNDGWGEGSCM